MITNNFTWKIGGEAGYGIKSVGALFAKAMVRQGLHVFTYDEYPSLIRGGHNAFEANVSDQPAFSPQRPVNVLIALDQATFNLHIGELSAEAGVIFDPASVTVNKSLVASSVKLIPVPLDEIINKAGAERIMRNTVALGASFALLDINFEVLRQLIAESFAGKKPEIISNNLKLAQLGYDYAKKNHAAGFFYKVRPLKNPGRVIMTGNEALAWGAIKAGCKLFAGYPMTPATSILHTLAEQAVKYGIVVKHTEDEISAINAVAGAGYAGVRAMTATAGGGFCLMVEAVGMAAMMEIPCVIVEAMRPGPSTGMPTWTGQGDLEFILHAAQDEFPRFVLAPGNIEQCFYSVGQAFNLAEKYQTPVVIVTDKHLAECYQSAMMFDQSKVNFFRGCVLSEKELDKNKKFQRYQMTESGVSPRALPGTKGGEHVANSDEHNEAGFTDEGSEERVKMMDKRWRKIAWAGKEIPQPSLEGEKHSPLTLISWGSVSGAVRQAIGELKKEGVKVNHMQIYCLNPFPVEAVKQVFKKAKQVAIVESNKTGQLANWLQLQTSLSPDYKILKYDGRPFFPHELVKTIKEIM